MGIITTRISALLTNTPDFKTAQTPLTLSPVTITLNINFPDAVQATIPQLLNHSLHLLPENTALIASAKDTNTDKVITAQLGIDTTTDHHNTSVTPQNESALKSGNTLDYIEPTSETATINPTQQALNFFQNQWLNNPYQNYSLVLVKTSNASTGGNKNTATPNYVQVRLEIKNGQVISVTSIDMEGVETPDPELASLTVENLFKLAQTALNDPQQTVEIEYNHLHNTPSSIKIQQGNNEVVYQTLIILPDEEITVVSTKIVYKDSGNDETLELNSPSTYLPISPSTWMPNDTSTLTLEVALPPPPTLGNGVSYPIPLSNNRYELLIQLLRTYIHMMQTVSQSTQQHYLIRETHSFHSVRNA